jgi:hypothetical protein
MNQQKFGVSGLALSLQKVKKPVGTIQPIEDNHVKPDKIVAGYKYTKKWYLLLQSPSGINGHLEWHEYSCFITIPSNTSKIT